MAKAVQMWKSEDGSLFETEAEADKHDAGKELWGIIQDAFPESYPGHVIEWVVGNYEKLEKLFSALR